MDSPSISWGAGKKQNTLFLLYWGVGGVGRERGVIKEHFTYCKHLISSEGKEFYL